MNVLHRRGHRHPPLNSKTTSKTIYKLLNDDDSWVISEGLNKSVYFMNLKSPDTDMYFFNGLMYRM